MLAIDEAQDESHALQEGLLSNHAHAMQSRFKEFTVVVSVAQSLPRRPVLSIHINENEQYQFRFQYQHSAVKLQRGHRVVSSVARSQPQRSVLSISRSAWLSSVH